MAKEEVLVAERAVMYTLGFDLNAHHPYMFLIQQLSKLGLLQANVQEGNNPFKLLMQNAWNLINDRCARACLHFHPTLSLAWALDPVTYLSLVTSPAPRPVQTRPCHASCPALLPHPL